jgi:hypothetical protein
MVERVKLPDTSKPKTDEQQSAREQHDRVAQLRRREELRQYYLKEYGPYPERWEAGVRFGDPDFFDHAMSEWVADIAKRPKGMN